MHPQEISSVVSPDDCKRLDVTNMLEMDPESRMLVALRLYQEMIDTSSVVILAVLFMQARFPLLYIAGRVLSSSSSSYHQAQSILSTMGIVESGLESVIRHLPVMGMPTVWAWPGATTISPSDAPTTSAAYLPLPSPMGFYLVCSFCVTSF